MLLLLILLVCVFMLTQRIAKQFISIRSILIILLIKLGFSIIFLQFFKQYYQYPSDAESFIADASELSDFFEEKAGLQFKTIIGLQDDNDLKTIRPLLEKWHKPFNYGLPNDNRTVIRICLLGNLFIKAPPLVHYFNFSILSFIGLLAGYSGLRRMQFKAPTLSLLLPSVLFWSAAPLKEAISIFILGLIIFSASTQKKPLAAISFIFLLWALSLNRLFLLLAIIPSGMFFVIYKKDTINTKQLFIAGISGLLMLYIDYTFLPNGISHYILQKQADFYNMLHQISPAGSMVSIPQADSFIGLIVMYTSALINTAFRPFIWEAHNLASFLSGIENLFIAGLVLRALYLYIFKNRKLRKLEVCILLFTLISFLLIGASSPVLGALSRYRTPIVFILIPLLLRDKKISSYLKIKKATIN